MGPLRSIWRSLMKSPGAEVRAIAVRGVGGDRHGPPVEGQSVKGQSALRSGLFTQAWESVPNGGRLQPQRQRQQATLFVLAVVGVTGITGQRFYDQPTLDIDTVAPQTLYASRDATVINQKLTDERRKAVTTAAVPVLRVDTALNQSQQDSLVRTFRHGNELRDRLGPFPVVSTALVSTDVQRFVRRMPEGDWQRMLRELGSPARNSPGPNAPSSNTPVSGPNTPTPGTPDLATSSSSSPAQPLGEAALTRKALVQLQRYRQRASDIEFAQLQERLEQMRRRYSQASALLQNPDLAELNAAYTAELFTLSEKDWEQLKPRVSLAHDRLLLQGIPPGLSDSVLEQAIALHVELVIPEDPHQAVARHLLKQLLRPNLVQDAAATQRQAERAAESVADVLITVRNGEIIVREGELITQEQLVLLDEFNLSQRGPNWPGMVGFGGLILLEISAFVLLQQRWGPRFRRRDWAVIGILAVSTPLLFVLRVPVSSLPAVGLLVGSFYGSTLGLAAVGLLSVTMPIGLEMDAQMLVASAASGVVGALVAGGLRSREELALLGVGVGFTQGAVHLLVSLMLSAATGSVWYLLLRGAIFHALRGIAWSIVALGISPYLERLFDLITPIRMAELSNPNRPLLQRLAAETPGTFQHTLFVATLAEAAARALGCNVELVRAGTLYHDIGKMHDPEGFIENQMGGPNKHDVINDPWKSAAIIKKHVTEGQVMARRCRLPRELRAFIPEHQGTMRISYFYQQAQKLVEADPEHYSLCEADFRYDGPIPQSRETGIVMLADSCEAALRSLKDASSEEALNMVTKIIRARWKDNQLCDSGLSREDLERIAAVFVQIWQQFHHKRIPYPASPAPLPRPLLQSP